MEKSEKTPKPLDERERGFLENISRSIKDAVDDSDFETAHKLRKQLIDAAESKVISVEDAINAALTPFIKKDR